MRALGIDRAPSVGGMMRGAWVLRTLLGAVVACGTYSCGGSRRSNDASTDGGETDGSGDGGHGTFVNPAPGSPLFVGANFWNVDWEGSSNYFVDGVDFTTTTNPWRPELLADLAPYGVLRFMDWNKTNDAGNPQAHWTTRRQPTEPQNEPVAYEWQIDLCNRARTDYWVNVSHESTPADWQALANLIEDRLDPTLRVYVEWSNEVWNGSFPAHAYASGKASELGLAGSNPAESYHVHQSVRLFETFESVFGTTNPRLVNVIAGQAGWTGPCEAQVDALADATINPHGTRPDVYAIAPYVSATTMDGLNAALPEVLTWVADSATCATSMGVPLIAYEGGTDSYAAGIAGCTSLQHDSRMRAFYVAFLGGMADAGLRGPFAQYTHSGSCWGLKEDTDDPVANAPKYRGVLDFLGLP